MPIHLHCIVCRAQFEHERPAGKTGRNPCFCSAECRKAKELSRWRATDAARKAALVTVACKSCGDPIPARGNRRCDPCRDMAARAVRERENANRSKERLSVIVARAAERREERAAAVAARRVEREHYRADKPWLVAGLTPGEKYALRYRHDPVFNERERRRTQARPRSLAKPYEKALRYVLVRDGASSARMETLGCTPAQLRQRLEEQFGPGMTWDAFADGRIHMTHVVPLAMFDLRQDEHMLAAWALPNLRPMWAEDSLRRSAPLT